MKTKNKIIITSILAGLIILTACLKNLWTGFIYFSVSLLAVLCLFWCGMFIYSYIENYKWHFEEDFAYYKAEIINSTSIGEQDFETARPVYIKKFKRTQMRDKVIDVFKVLICFSLAITCIVTLATGVVC